VLILRQLCQPILDEAGFTQMHVEIDHHKNLAIKGTCGQTIVSISGITFAKRQVTNNEREFAVELFTKFLAENVDKLEDFVKVSKEYKKLKEPIAKDYYADMLVTGGRVIFPVVGGVHFYRDGIQTPGTKITSTTYSDLLKKYPKEFAAAEAFLNDKAEFDLQGRMVSTARSEIAKCSI